MNIANVHTSLEYVEKYFPEDSLFEFGVCTGDSLFDILVTLIHKNNKPTKVFGFDSFEGLPDEMPGITIPPNWTKGAFALKDHYPRWGEQTIEAGLNYLTQKFAPFQKYNIDISLIKGWFSDTLNKNTIKENKISPAKYIHIDTDIYISTKQVLEWLVQNNLFANNCIVRYDDWDMTGYHIPQETAGQSLAHKETVQKYNIRFKKLYDNLYRIEL